MELLIQAEVTVEM